MNRHAVALAFACVLFAAPAVAQSPLPIDSDVVLLRVAGPWQAGGQKGFSRLVARAAGGQISLSVEWIADTGALVRAAPLAMPPGADQLPLSRVRNTQRFEGSSVTFDTADGDTFVLTVGAPGDASFGTASN